MSLGDVVKNLWSSQGTLIRNERVCMGYLSSKNKIKSYLCEYAYESAYVFSICFAEKNKKKSFLFSLKQTLFKR